jgi:holo-[acyl-carrier protein] synthase
VIDPPSGGYDRVSRRRGMVLRNQFLSNDFTHYFTKFEQNHTLMIAGLGIDIVEVERIEEKLQKNNGFRELVFSENEIAYCESRTNKFEHYAARFAAKEAFFKALGTGWLNGTAFSEVEITNNELGKPEITLLGGTHDVISAMGFNSMHVSLTHVKNMASAVVVLEKG